MRRAISMMALFLAAPLAPAQPIAPGAQGAANNVKGILDKPVDDRFVVLRGKLTNQVNAEQYIFTDGSAEIRVEIDAEDLPPQSIDPATIVEIAGEVERDFRQPIEIDVDRITVIDRKADAAGS